MSDCRLVRARQIENEVPLEHKAVDDVLGGAEAWKNADQTDGAPDAECTITHKDLTLMRVCFGVHCSELWQVHEPTCLLPAAADPLRRRAHDHFLQVYGVWPSLARGLTAPLHISPLAAHVSPGGPASTCGHSGHQYVGALPLLCSECPPLSRNSEHGRSLSSRARLCALVDFCDVVRGRSVDRCVCTQ